MRGLPVALVLIVTGLLLLHQSGNCVDFYLLGYSGKGELIPARLCTVPQSGVFVDARVAGTNLAKSLEVARDSFSRRHGPLTVGFTLSIEGPATLIDGRSADIALYSAIYSLLNHKKPPLATGRIGDDLYSVEGVAYVREKIQAAHSVVIIPYANRRDIPESGLTVAVKNLDELDGVLASLPS